MNCLYAQGAPLAPSSLTQMISGLVGQLLMPGQPGWCQMNFILKAANKPAIPYFHHDAVIVVSYVVLMLWPSSFFFKYLYFILSVNVMS